MQWVAELIIEAMTQKIKARQQKQLVIEALQLAPDLRNSTETLSFREIMRDVEIGKFAYRWKGCGLAWGNDIVEGATAPAPARVLSSRFVDALDPEIPHERYFLTSNAAAGMLRRADTVGRTFFPPMRAALENLAIIPHMVDGVSQAAPNPQRAPGESIAKTSICPPRPIERGPDERANAGAGGTVRLAY